MSKAPLGTLEHQIYLLLKAKGSASVKEICFLLDNSRKYTTVMTIMNRMVEKEELTREKKGSCFIYQINKSLSKKLPQIITKIKHSLFQGKTKQMVSYLLESDTKITKQELKEIAEIINKMKG